MATQPPTTLDSIPPLRRKTPLTDIGNGELIACLYKGRLCFDHSRGKWLIFREHWWTEDVDGEVYRMAKEAARFRYCRSYSLPEDREEEAKWARKSESRERVEAALACARNERSIADSGHGWDSNPWLMGVGNGILDLQNGTLRAGCPEDRITLATPVLFDPDAKCPKWEQFLSQVFAGNSEMIGFIQRAVGYSLTGDVSEQCLFLCYGAGGNGKSTFLDVIGYVTRNYSYNLPFSAFELNGRSAIPNDIAALRSKRFVTAVETSESAQLNAARIKSLTGSDPITARFLHRE